LAPNVCNLLDQLGLKPRISLYWQDDLISNWPSCVHLYQYTAYCVFIQDLLTEPMLHC